MRGRRNRGAAGLVVVRVRGNARRGRGQAAPPARKDRIGLRLALARDGAAKRIGPYLRRRAGGTDSRDREGARPPAAVPRHPVARPVGRRAGPSLTGVSPELRREPALLRQLHEHQRRHPRRRVPRSRGSGARTRPRAPRGRPAVREPQRRPARVRSRRLSLRRHGRRRLRRRPGRGGAGSLLAPRQDAPAGHRQLRLGLGDRRLRPAKPVALLVRSPDREPLHR